MQNKKEEILQVIKKARKNGYKSFFAYMVIECYLNVTVLDRVYGEFRWFDSIVFSHDFCKAYFGKYFHDSGRKKGYANWEYHIMQLALSEDRLKYLIAHLYEKESL